MVLGGQLSNHAAPRVRPDRTQREDTSPESPPTARNRSISPTTVDQIVTAYCEGTPIRQICRDLNMHRTTVDNCLKRAGIKQPRQPRLTEADLDQAETAYLAGDSWATIAKRLGVHPGTIGYHLRRRGVPMRPRRGGIRRDEDDR